MATRTAVMSGQFYPSGEKSCTRQIEECLKDVKKLDNIGKVVAGIVPHAGWTFSGPTAAKVLSQIDRDKPPSTLILFGAVHRWGVGGPAIFSRGSWETPLGNIAIDEELAQKIIAQTKGALTEDTSAHSQEHSIEVQLPFIAHLFPGVKIIPIAVPPDNKSHVIGEVIGEFMTTHHIDGIVIGTTDLTHYGPNYRFSPKGVGEEALQWVKETNDPSIIKLALDMEADKIVEEAEKNHNACGSGAMAATVAAASAMGAGKGILLEYTTSYDIMPHQGASSFVGYAGIVFAEKS